MTSIETTRLELQNRLDAAKTPQERNRLGQFATPTALATDILAVARKLLPTDEPVRFLDPAFGTGSFYSALLHMFPEQQILRATGFEIDQHYGEEAAHLWESAPLILRLEDFTRAKPPETDAERANLIICNPPYVRHHHLTRQDKDRLLLVSARQTGLRLSGLSGLYCYFLTLSHAWLARDGIAGWLIPSEWMDVNYGGPIKEYLLNHATLLGIQRFDPSDMQFGDALVSSVVVWLKKQPRTRDHAVIFSYGGRQTAPKISKAIPADWLNNESKWTRYPFADQKAASQSTIRLSDLFNIKRGLATGANEFFILTREKIAKHNLPTQFLKPILPSPRYLKADEILADNYGMPLLDEPQFLLNCNLPEDQVRKEHFALWEYLQRGVMEGFHAGSCQSHRPFSIMPSSRQTPKEMPNGRTAV